MTDRLFQNFTLLLTQASKTKSLFPPLQFSILNFSYTTTPANSFSNESLYSKELTLFAISKQCSTMNDIKQFHGHITKTGFAQNLFVIGKVIAFCAVSKQGDMVYAASVFDEIPNPDGFLWNTMIRGFGKVNDVEKCFDYYKRMIEIGEFADNFTFCFLLKVCTQLGLAELGKQIHCSIMKHGLDSHVFVRNTLIHMYGKFKEVGTAVKLFEEIPNPDVVAWNTIIDSHVFCENYKEAIALFLRMLRAGINPDEATLVVTLSACSALGELGFGKWVHSCVRNSQHATVVAVSNSLIDMYTKCGAVNEAMETFSMMRQRNIVSWNTMILGLALHGHAKDALQFFSKMVNEKLERPDDITLLGVLSACNHGGMVEEGRKYFESMKIDYCIEPTIKHYGCMVDILGRVGLVNEAYQLIESMPMACNAVVWRTVLASCRNHGNVELGEKVRMRLLEIEPDHSSDYVLLANMYAGEGNWNKVVTVRNSMQSRGVQKPEPGNSFIDIRPETKLETENNNYIDVIKS